MMMIQTQVDMGDPFRWGTPECTARRGVSSCPRRPRMASAEVVVPSLEGCDGRPTENNPDESRPTPATPLVYVQCMAAKSKRRKDTEPGGRPARPGGGQAKVFRRKSCLFCKDKVREVDYKNVEQLRRYTSERGKIRSRRMSGACRRHQRQIAVAIKRAR